MRRLPNLLFVAIILAALLLPAFAAGATPSTAPAAAGGGIQVRVPNFAFDPVADGEPKLSNSERFDGQEAGFRLVQFYGPTEDAWLDGLQGAGLKVLQYYPHYTYLVWGAEGALRAAEGLNFVRWAGNFHPAYKINSDLVGREGVVQNVDVMFYNNGDTKGTLDSLTALGGKVIQAYPAQPDQAFFVAVVELNAAAFDAVSRLGTVLWLGYSHPTPVLDDEMSSQIQAGNYSGAGVPFTGYNAHLGTLGVDGSGVRWATIDTGVDYDHPDFAGRIVAGYSFPGTCAGPAGTDCPGGGHGTHVTGIIGGDAAGAFADPQGFLYGLGVAPNYDIVAMNSLSAAAWPPAGGWQEHSKQAVLLNAIGGNNSWTTGEGTNHGYQASERTHDITVLDGNFDTAAVEPFIQVFSAGNSGPGANTLTAPKEGKNLIIVAASQNYRVGSINNIASFSSRGPSVDGRIVPTITTPGEQIASARNDTGGSCSTAIAGTNNLYAFCSGTSMAAPHAAGAVVLATEWWRGFNAGANPSAAMAKALLVNSAVDMGTADIPNFNEGWGRVNITKMIQPGVNTEYWDNPVVFANSGEQWTLSFRRGRHQQTAQDHPGLERRTRCGGREPRSGQQPEPDRRQRRQQLPRQRLQRRLERHRRRGRHPQQPGERLHPESFRQRQHHHRRGQHRGRRSAGQRLILTDQSFSLICQNCLLAPTSAWTSRRPARTSAPPAMPSTTSMWAASWATTTR
jgi:subtilisin family serine protease